MRYPLGEIAAAVGGHIVGDKEIIIERIVTDSRGAGCSSSDLFIALCGENHNGHDFIAQMYSSGVKAFMVAEGERSRLPEGSCAVVVSDTLDALQRLAAFHRNSFAGQVVAITGSNGKTITKEWLSTLYPSGVKVFRSPRSYNSQVGVALSLLMAEGDEQVVIIEAGISHCGEMFRLEKMIRPDIGAVINIGDAHGENFSSTIEKIREKCELLKNCKSIIYDTDNKELTQYIQNFSASRLIGISSAEGNIYLPSGAIITPDLKGLIYKDFGSRQNVLAALSIVSASGFDIDSATLKLAELQPVAMRLELLDGINGCKIVNDSYNSDLNSLRLALGYMSSVSAGSSRWLVLSDILQSGRDEGSLYRQVAAEISDSKIDMLIGIGSAISRHSELFSCCKEFFSDTESFIKTLEHRDLKNCTILLKGSRPFRFEEISRRLERRIHTTILEVNLDSISHNLNHLRHKLPAGTGVVAMVKAFGYGMGGYEVAKMLENQRCDYLAVAFADEGVSLRREGITLPILVLNADAWSFSQMISYRLEPEIYSLTSLKMFITELERSGMENYPIHLKLDTGMHRLGFNSEELSQALDILSSSNRIRIKSVFSHLAASDEAAHDEFTRGQIAQFESLCAQIDHRLPGIGYLRHIANSAATERFPEATFDMVRIGIGLYGISAVEECNLQNVCTLKTKIVQIKHIAAGETIGYGRHGRADQGKTIATIPIGYADGLDRRLGNGNWSVKVGDHFAPIIGNVCMDTCMIDVSGLTVNEGDSVTIFGAENNVSQMATVLGTIPYEVMTNISKRVKRVYIKE